MVGKGRARRTGPKALLVPLNFSLLKQWLKTNLQAFWAEHGLKVLICRAQGGCSLDCVRVVEKSGARSLLRGGFWW